MTIMVLLATGIASFVLPALLWGRDRFSVLFTNDPVRALFGLVLVFNVYVIYEQLQIHRIRHEIADQLYRMSVLDSLTGLFNRGYIERRLIEEIARSRRQESPLTVIMFDLNNFKKVNDKHGHAVGDSVLKGFADRLKRATRGSDVAARYGGDEFVLLLPDCSSEGVQYVFKRLSGIQVKTNKGRLPICCSAGWADYIPGESLAAFLKRADEALYVNKQSQRAQFPDVRS